MQYRYWPDADVLELVLSDREVADTYMPQPELVVKVDARGLPVAIHLICASKFVDVGRLISE